jgi:hypothetical protein|tara:strand:+ start:16 stop:468 length:453 start_codon:yes stop_codon:yes gene_type:complete
MNIQRVKQGARVTYANGVYMMLLGLFIILFDNMNMSTNFNSINQLWGFFSKFNPEISYIFILFHILIGTLLFSSGIMILYLSDYIIKRKEKMTWIILFIVGIINWVALLIISIILGNILLIILTAIGWLTFIFGMLLPIKYYLEKSYREY